MLKEPEYLLIQSLHKKGNSIRRINSLFGYSRNTIRKVLIDQAPIPCNAPMQSSRDREHKEILLLRSDYERHPMGNRRFEKYVGYLESATFPKFQMLYRDVNCHTWMHCLSQGKVTCDELLYQTQLDAESVRILRDWVLTKPLKYRNRALAVLARGRQYPVRSVARFLCTNRSRVRDYLARFETGGVDALSDKKRAKQMKFERPEYKEIVFKTLHAPPSTFGFNRTTWRMDDLRSVLKKEGFPICVSYIRRILKDAGYRYLKAKKVLTSTDPEYREKLVAITNILSNLKQNEKFFSIDEYGPFAIKTRGGKSLVPPGEERTFPQRQKSKGCLIMTAALELSTNQVTHFYSKKKNTDEMIKLLEVLLDQYKDEERIYLSWDAASWHASKKIYAKVDHVNESVFRKSHGTPIVELAPLPACAQFLNVIESVFSGMSRAIIHNSDYISVDECKDAIDRYFVERNQQFLENPKRAGNKIWGKEITKAKFLESNNCKDPRYCR